MTKKSLCCGADVDYQECKDIYYCLACDNFCDLQKNEDLTLAEVYAVKDDVNSFSRKGEYCYEFEMKYFSWDALPSEMWLTGRFTITDRKSWHRHEKKEVEHSHKDDDIRLSIAEAVQSKEIKIGDKLTAEEAQRYIESGGFVQVKTGVTHYIYRLIHGDLEYWDSENWNISGNKNLYSFNREFTAVENPEKQTESEVDRLKKNLADEQIKVKELNEDCYGLKKEVEELRRKNRILTDSAKEINELADQQVADLKTQLEAERKKSDWLPYPENKPETQGLVLVKRYDRDAPSMAYSRHEGFLIDDFIVTDQVKFFKEV